MHHSYRPSSVQTGQYIHSLHYSLFSCDEAFSMNVSILEDYFIDFVLIY